MRGKMLTTLCSFSVCISMQNAVLAADQAPVVNASMPLASASASAPAAAPIAAPLTAAANAATTAPAPAPSATAPSPTAPSPTAPSPTAPSATAPSATAPSATVPSPAAPPAAPPAAAELAPTLSATKARTAVKTAAPAPKAAPADPKEIEEQLHDLVDTLKKVYNAAQSLQSECNRTYNADALDNVIMDPWMAGEPGLANVMSPPFPGALKALPARKKWVDYDQTQITHLLRMLTNEVNNIGAASSIDTSLKVTVEILQDNLQQVDEQYAHLNSLINPSTVDAKGQPNYDKTAITKTAQALKDETSGMNELRKRLLRQLKEVTKDK
ncbi:MAG TPA: hypothetical protein V6C89_01100 [Drouetiella sp.]